MSPDVLSGDIPLSLLEEVRLEIQHYFVPLLVASREQPNDNPVDLAGSGTLVELEGKHFILTADHVWDRAQQWAEIGLMLADGGAPLGIPRDHLVPKRLGDNPHSRWGPDLALLELPPHLVGTITARKSFLNLTRRRSMLVEHPPQLEKTIWAVMGLIGEKSKVELLAEGHMALATIRGEAFFGVTCTAEQREEYDYLTVYAETTLLGVPSSFAGVSGGGLWQITLKMKGDMIVSLGGHHFRGVAFWEEAQPPNRIAIRCHGPRSIFQTAWSKWALPEAGQEGGR